MKKLLLLLLINLLPLIAGATTWRVAQDGSGDFNGSDETPILAAIAQAKKSGGGDVVIQAGVYHMGKILRLHGVKHLRIRGEGKVVLQLAPALVTELAEPATPGATTLRLSSPEGLQAGLTLRIMAPGEIVVITGRPKPSFEADILKVDGPVATLTQPLRFAAPAGTAVVNERDLNLLVIEGDSEDITVENLSMDGGLKPDGLRQATHHTRCAIWVQGAYDYLKGPSGPKPRRITIRDCQIRHFHGRGVAIYSADDCLVENCVIEDTLDEGINLDHFVVHCRTAGNVIRGATVGVELNDTNDCVVERNVIEKCAIGIRLWRYCRLEELNVRNEVLANRIKDIKGAAVELKEGTASNLVRGNVLEIPPGDVGKLENFFRNAGKHNRFEDNRLELR
jgi:hypothetical protein